MHKLNNVIVLYLHTIECFSLQWSKITTYLTVALCNGKLRSGIIARLLNYKEYSGNFLMLVIWPYISRPKETGAKKVLSFKKYKIQPFFLLLFFPFSFPLEVWLLCQLSTRCYTNQSLGSLKLLFLLQKLYSRCPLAQNWS